MQPSRRRTRTPAFRLPLGRPWCEALQLENGRKLLLRPIEPRDADALRRSFGHLTAEEIRFRFLYPLTELTTEHAAALSAVDRQHGFALVLVEALPPDLALIGGVARAVIDARGSAEFAIIVGKEISGFGLGRHILTRLIEWCRKKGLASIYGDVMIENERMLRLARSLGFGLRFENASMVRIELVLRPARRS